MNFSIAGLVISYAILFTPVYLNFLNGAWAREENAHMPFILAICIGLGFTEFSSGRIKLVSHSIEKFIGGLILSVGLLLFFYSRIEEVELVLSITQLIIIFGSVLMVSGIKGVQSLWFVFALSLYLVLWPGWAMDMVTFPLKMMISAQVADGLFFFGFPVSHEGAIISAGAYELLVADACSGINSLIALTSVGVVYLYVIKRPNPYSNVVTLLMLIPIAILANMIRVAALVMITYFLGYDAGQSFLHDLSGLIMFAVALLGVFAVEALAAKFLGPKAELNMHSDLLSKGGARHD